QGTKLAELYLPLMDDDSIVNERHRHRYEVNPDYVESLEAAGMLVSGFTPGRRGRGEGLVEAIELPGHPFYLGLQSHPEFMSRLMRPSPPFTGFIQAAVERSSATVADVPISLA